MSPVSFVTPSYQCVCRLVAETLDYIRCLWSLANKHDIKNDNFEKLPVTARVLLKSAAFPPSLFTLTTTATMSDRDPYDLRAATYTRFRILVIGRANAGKTTLLQRVCDTTEDPCIYDGNNKNLVSFHRPQADDEFRFWHFLLAWTYLSDTPLTTDIY